MRRDASIRALAEVWLWRHGWAWPLAALVTGATAVVYGAVWQPQRTRIAELVSTIEQVRAAKHQLRAAAASQPVTPAADIRTAIASAATVDQLVAHWVELAQAEGIALPQSEYQQHLVADSTLVQVQITQPVRATFPQIRRYVEAVLRSTPNASLDQLTARRENVGQPQLEARLRWSLWAPGASHDAANAPSERLTLSDRNDIGAPVLQPRDLFATRSWTPPPPPPPPAPVESAAPVAPPLPFTFLGKKFERDAWEIYLARGDQTFIASPGAVIDGTYRVDHIEPPLLVMTYLPLGQSQTLQIGDPQ